MKASYRPQQHRSSRRGFTLIEMMIAMVLVSILMAAAFMLSRVVSQVFSVQDQTVDAQGNLKFALDFVSRDVERAGYLATPSAARDPLICPRPEVNFGLGNLVGIRVVDGGSSAAVFSDGSANNANIAPDELFLMGSFDAATTFPVVNVQPGQPIAFNPTRLAQGLGDTNREARFMALFSPGRLIKISDPTGVAQLAPIEKRIWNGGDATIDVTGLVQRDEGRGCGIEGIAGEGYEVSVINVVRYAVERDPKDSTKMDLVRTEINPRTNQTLLLDGVHSYAVPVLEYVVDFQVSLDVDNSTFGAPEMTVDTLSGDNEGNIGLAGLAARQDWAKARVANVVLSSRTQREDPSLQHQVRGSLTAPLLTFNLDDDPSGSTRVMTLTNSLQLTNLTIRNVK